MKRLLADAACALFWVAMTPVYRVVRRAVEDVLATGELAFAVEEVELPVTTVPLEPSLAALEEQFEVWEPEHEWRARWDMMRP